MPKYYFPIFHRQHQSRMTVEDEFGQKLFAIHINAEMK